MMSRYHLLHCIPNPRMHGLNGYKEVIETVAWGLQQLGHQVSYGVNQLESGATNIVFGGQVAPLAALRQLPEGTIIYNFEQMNAATAQQAREQLKFHARSPTFTIWDYSSANLPAWRALGRDQAKVVPVGYAAVLTRIPKPADQDIDVLIYGLSGQRRLHTFQALSMLGLTTVFVSGLYGKARDDLIARSKLVFRVSYLLANKKAVVSDLDRNTTIDQGIKDGIRFVSSLDELTQACTTLIENDRERVAWEERGFYCMTKRDIVPILTDALG
jgi:hypothetical protein